MERFSPGHHLHELTPFSGHTISGGLRLLLFAAVAVDGPHNLLLPLGESLQEPVKGAGYARVTETYKPVFTPTHTYTHLNTP